MSKTISTPSLNHNIDRNPSISKSSESNFVLGLSTTFFTAGIIGSLWYTKRKAKPLSTEIFSTSNQLGINSGYRIATLYSFQALAIGTILCVSVSGLCAIGIGTLLGVSNLREFHGKMKDLVPYYVPSLRKTLKNSEKIKLSNSEQDDWKILQDEWEKHLLEKKLKEIQNPPPKKWWQK
ncbi:3964_t:CDS:2 [Diversispora eburnea]|uniref:3964_t:CDS:1 n=1 Tax=Diversispora eburnea TaxID=1213867 RepID=A0A9N8Z1I3_9GLOM|nr:3964_t:CDS:2 [Diversispora eburnea]